jgi:hypothetical protein
MLQEETQALEAFLTKEFLKSAATLTSTSSAGGRSGGGGVSRSVSRNSLTDGGNDNGGDGNGGDGNGDAREAAAAAVVAAQKLKAKNKKELQQQQRRRRVLVGPRVQAVVLKLKLFGVDTMRDLTDDHLVDAHSISNEVTTTAAKI